MNATFHRSRRMWRHAALGILIVLCLALAGCSALTGALGGALSTPADSTGKSLPSAGPETPFPTAAGHLPAASASVGSHVGSHAIVCVQPITPGGGGPPCVPVGESLAVETALAALSSVERDAVKGSAWSAGGAACSVEAKPVGCVAPETALGVVTFSFRDGAPEVRVLVYRHVDGSLGATRLG